MANTSQPPPTSGGASSRCRGEVVSFAKGYGFIRPEAGTGATPAAAATPGGRPSQPRNLFVHHSNILAEEGYTAVTLREGQKVTYQVGEGEKGPVAINVGDFNGKPFAAPAGGGFGAATRQRSSDPATSSSSSRPPREAPPPRTTDATSGGAVIRGVIAQWADGSRFGFISGDNGVRYFVPGANCQMDPTQRRCQQLNVGQKVEFMCLEDDKGAQCPVASDVTGPHRTPLLNGTLQPERPSPVAPSTTSAAGGGRGGGGWRSAAPAARGGAAGGEQPDSRWECLHDRY